MWRFMPTARSPWLRPQDRPVGLAIERDVARAERCRHWLQGVGAAETAGPRPLYHPSTAALRAFRAHPQFMPPVGVAYDFLQDAAHPLSLSRLSDEAMWSLYHFASHGRLQSMQGNSVPWHASPQALALWEPYRRMETHLTDARQRTSFAAWSRPVLDAICRWSNTSRPSEQPVVWMDRARSLQQWAPRAQSQPRAALGSLDAIASACWMGALCTTLVVALCDATHHTMAPPLVYLSLAILVAWISAATIRIVSRTCHQIRNEQQTARA